MTDFTIKLVLQDWAKVEDAKTTITHDKIETDASRSTAYAIWYRAGYPAVIANSIILVSG